MELHTAADFDEIDIDIYNTALAIEPKVTELVRHTAEQLDLQTVCLGTRVKSLDSIYEKMHERGKPKEMTDLKDIIRYTLVAPEKTYTESLPAIIDEIQKAGYRIVELDNKWQSPDEYHGVHMVFQAPNRTLFELQVHTEESLFAKTMAHKLYKEERVLPDTRETYPTRKALQESMKMFFMETPFPKNIELIQNYSAEIEPIVSNGEIVIASDDDRDYPEYLLDDESNELMLAMKMHEDEPEHEHPHADRQYVKIGEEH